MMLKELQKKSFKKVLPMLLVLLAVGIGLLWGSGFGVFKLIGGGKVLDELPPDQMVGKYVTYSVDFLYGTYAYTTETSKSNPRPVTVNSEYVIPVGYDGGRYMGLFVPKAYLSELDKLNDECIAYINEEGDQPSDYYTVTGTVLPMDKESIDYFHEAVGYDDGDTEYQAMFEPYYLKIGYLGKTEFGLTIFLSVLSAVCLLGAVIIFVHGISGHYQKKLRKIAGNAGISMEQLESWYAAAPEINGLHIGGNWVMFNEGAYTQLFRVTDLAWIYQQTTTHCTNGIKTGTSYGLVLRFLSGKKMFILPMGQETEVFTTLQYIGQNFPGIVIGYTKEREAAYKRDAAGFVREELAKEGITPPELY